MDSTNTIGTPYDDVFRTLLVDCRKLIIPVVNEAFNESYTGDVMGGQILETRTKTMYNRGIEEGRMERLVALVLHMHDKNYSDEQIVDATDESLESIKQIIRENR